MSANVKVMNVPVIAAPRGAAVAAAVASAAWKLVARLFSSAPARAPSRVEEAARLREYAMSISKNDPGFAADLFAAADRHEIQPR